MKVLWSALWCALVFASHVSLAQSASFENKLADEVDEQATAQAPWKEGEVIGQGRVRFSAFVVSVERKFIGITNKGYFVVQDLYQGSGKNATDPFVIVERDSVEEFGEYSSKPLDGELIIWSEEGEKLTRGHYQNGKLQGVWIEWHDNGQKWSERSYQDGRLQGWVTMWYRNGQKWDECEYQDGLRQGLRTQWYASGQKMNEVHYQDDKPQGTMVRWYESGKKWREEFYENGRPSEFWTEWDEDGNQVS